MQGTLYDLFTSVAVTWSQPVPAVELRCCLPLSSLTLVTGLQGLCQEDSASSFWRNVHSALPVGFVEMQPLVR